jgi:predicted secreted Zn-dependent protease
MRTSILLLTSATLGGCAAPPGASPPPALPAGVRAFVQEQPYEVTGLTHADIARSLRTGGRAAIGEPVRGWHQWSLRWSFRFVSSPRGCEITESTVNLESTIILPEWVDRERADSALVADWDGYIGGLRTHENGHRDIAHRAAAEVQRTLRRFIAPSCTTIERDANRAAREITDRHRRLNAEYDEKTRGGGTQGASWPPRRG